MRHRSALLTAILAASSSWLVSASAGEAPAAAARAERQGAGAAAVWWAYRPVQRPELPVVKEAGWTRNAIDRFILARLEAVGLSPAPPAGRPVLARRLSYDLTGLPPSSAEVEAFDLDPAPDAYERLIERLLASPHHGEKWGRHWLDLVRYAETNGYERDATKPYAWRYRDYVIRSFNEDRSYDLFVREQLAGDELEPPTADSIIATGYYRLGLWDDEAADMAQARYDELDDIVATTAQAFLGASLNCARCHDHKADPFPQADYYRFLAFFQDLPRYGARSMSERHVLTDITRWMRAPEENRRVDGLVDRKESLRAELRAIEEAGIARLSAEEKRLTEGPERERVLAARLRQHLDAGERERYAAARSELARLEKELGAARDLALSVNGCDLSPPETHVLRRGSPHAPEEKVEPAFPLALGGGEAIVPPPGPDARSAGRRSVLATWIASASNPLTARVAANRLWQHHFGRGLVRSTNDFGRLGELPTHPELLDWLASELARLDWSFKAMHRRLVASSAYRMAAAEDAAALARDPANDLFWRFDMRRLAAEEVRDSILAANGCLNAAMGGPSVYTEVPAEVLHTASRPGDAWGTSPPAERDRRSVYVFIKRSLLEPTLAAFDLADPDASCAARYSTTVPTQALSSLNGEFFRREARRLAARLRREAGGERPAQARLALRLALGREPRADEVARDVALLEALEKDDGLGAAEALDLYCLLVLNLNEFLYLD